MRRFAAILFTLLVSAGCRAPEKPVIGVVPRGSGQIYWQSVHAGAVKAARELNVNVEWLAPANQLDASHQAAIVDSLVQRRIAGIVLAPADASLLVPAVERAAAAGIPVAVIDSDLATSKRLTRIAADNHESGRQAADRLGELLRGEGEAAIVDMSVRDEAAAQREAAFTEELQVKYPKVRLLPTVYVTGGKTEAIAVTRSVLDAHPGLTGLFAAALTCSEGAVYELRRRGTSKVRVVAFDASPEIVGELRNRFIDVLIVPDPVRLGYEGVAAVAARLRGETLRQEIACNARVVDRSNVENPESVMVLYPDLKSFLGPETN